LILSGFSTRNKMKNKNYHNVGTVPKSNLKIVERDKVYTPYPAYT